MTVSVTPELGYPPAWFSAALAASADVAVVTVDGAPISYRAWGGNEPSGLVLVHGGAAHARWWDHIGPLLAQGRRVVAVDLSGHGDSGRRERYSLDGWAREVMAVARGRRHFRAANHRGPQHGRLRCLAGGRGVRCRA